ncbi:hypothetical protein AXF42_Ash021473 [Apostasia shenzhenica]|uniref:Rab3 GTPase-activating protein catalytic subunit n=1 Tax=Apostasia shenzhenica TaxID=1088818 RepID=A0A2H9ZTQ1_9ASPA|nr:hypothetical protein AXF42_Ash021473 [Apostasia shenzhenica]
MIRKELQTDSRSPMSVVHGSQDTLASSSCHQGHETQGGSAQRRGSAGVVESVMLLLSSQKMHAPVIQNAPPMTEDMHEERLRAAEAFGDAFRLERPLPPLLCSSSYWVIEKKTSLLTWSGLNADGS